MRVRSFYRFLLPLCLTAAIVLPSTCRAAVDLNFQTAITSPSTAGEVGMHQGASVALNERFAVVGAPEAAAASPDPGRVNVFDAETGAFRFTIINPDPVYSSYGFGTSIALSGSLLFVGSPGDCEKQWFAGVVRIYNLDAANPSIPVRVLFAPAPTGSANFGAAISVNGQQLIVGAPGESGGKAYVFDLSSPTPNQPTHTLQHPLQTASSEFGRSVAISGNRVVVNASIHQAGTLSAGTYAFELQDGGAANLTTTIMSPLTGTYQVADCFGRSLSLDGNNLLIGDPRPSSLDDQIGHAYLHDLASATPELPKTTFVIPYPLDNIGIGTAVTLRGNRAFIGVFGATSLESVEEYDLNGVTPAVSVRSIANPAPWWDTGFGSAMALHGDRLLIGAPGRNGTVDDEGIAHLFETPAGSETTLRTSFEQPLPTIEEGFGSVVIASGMRLFVGSPGAWKEGFVAMYDLATIHGLIPTRIFRVPQYPGRELSLWRFGGAIAVAGNRLVVGSEVNARDVWVYDLTSASDQPQFFLRKPSSDFTDDFGSVVAASGDWVAVSTRAQTGSHKVFLYDLSSASPESPVHILTQPPAISARFGSALAIEGSRLAVGNCYEKDGNKIHVGAVYVYDLNSPDLTTPQYRLAQSGPTIYQGSYFGFALSISDGKLAISAPSDAFAPGGPSPGRVFIHDLDGASPTVAISQYFSYSSSEGFGNFIKLEGTRLAVGSRANSGVVNIYDITNPVNVPHSTAKAPPVGSDQVLGFGNSVAFIGDSIAVGAKQADYLAYDKGGVVLYGPSGGTPNAAFGEVSEISYTSAKLHLTINPAWSMVEFQVQCRELSTAPYTTVATVRPYGDTSFSFDVPLSNLTPGVTHEVRVMTTLSTVPLDHASFTTTLDITPPDLRPPVEGFTPRVLTGDQPPLPDYTTQAIASDAAGLISVEQDPPAGTPMPVGVHQVTLTATDVANAHTSISFSIRVRPETESVPMVIAATGELVVEPGSPIPGIPESAIWTRFEEPAIGESGSLAVVGHWRAGREKGCVLTLVKPNGERLARAQVGGFTINQQAKIRALRDPLLASDDSMIFSATLDGPDGKRIGAQAICWISPNLDYPVIVARTDVPVADLGNVTLQSFGAAAVTAGSRVLIRATIKRGKGVTNRNDEVLLQWSRDFGVLSPFLREGQPFANFGTVVSFQTLLAGPASAGADRGWLREDDARPSPALGKHVAINFSAKFEDGVQRFISVHGLSRQVLSANGPAGTSANTGFASVGLPAFRADSSDTVAFPAKRIDRANVFCAVNLAENFSREVSSAGDPTSIAARIDTVSDVVASPFGGFEVWTGRLASRQGPLSSKQFLASSELGENPQIFARAGQDAADCPEGTRWKAFTSIACPGQEARAVFAASLTGRGVTSARDQGIWSVGLDRVPRLLLREGDSVDGKPVASFKALPTNALSKGSARACNTLHQVAVLLTFRDRTTAIAILDAR